MMEPKVYATFNMELDNIAINSTYIQWGRSTRKIGGCVICGPGSLVLKNENQRKRLKKGITERGEVIPDQTINKLIELITELYQEEQLNGQFIIYNLFTMKDTFISTDDKIKEIRFNSLLNSDFRELEKDIEELPWLLLAWGCEEKKVINEQKKKWFDFIKEINIRIFGKKGKKEIHYCNLKQRSEKNDEEYKNTILKQFKKYKRKKKSNLVIFNREAFYPNIYIRKNKQEEHNNIGIWELHPINPDYIIRSFSNIKLKEGYKLVGYRTYESLGSFGSVWAIPEGTQIQTDDENIKESDIYQFLKSKGAIDNLMDVIIGDHSPLSYLQAAMASRQLYNYGNTWHYLYTEHDILLPLPSRLNKNKNDDGSKYEWTMHEDEPEIVKPHFYYNNKRPVIVFYAINETGEIDFVEYKYIFSEYNYSYELETRLIATAGIGFLF